jgi:uncharacterized protein YecE (DUF72 family)
MRHGSIAAVRVWAGTSGWSYPKWKGSFYPEDLPAKKFLEYYASKFAAVEINNTFYRMPKPEVLRGWSEQVDPLGGEFRFILKAPQRITHIKRLKEAGEDVAYFLRTAEELGDRLGPVLVQLPPNMKFDRDRLERFLDDVAAARPETRLAFEFRHASWFEGGALDTLAARGCAWCDADTDEAPVDEIHATTDWGYLRLRREVYDDAALSEWARRVAATPWQEAFVFFKHEDAGTGPRYAAAFLDALPR